MDEYVVKDHKKLRKGFTTGTCAAAAAKGASLTLLAASGFPVSAPQSVEVFTPAGVPLTIPLAESRLEQGGIGLPREGRSASAAELKSGERLREDVCAVCAVKKDSGDDPDVTDGVLVYARVALDLAGCPGRVEIDGGDGVGRVTKPGLACAVGEAAINPTPRRMIGEEVRRAADEAGYEGGISVEIFIPAGAELAKRTYNPRLGIEGGISVLGTSGIVEPMSEQALIDTIKVEMNQQKASGAEYILLTPGNYGEAFLKETMGLGRVYTVKCSNFLGESLDYALELGFRGLLLVAHIGKLVKVAGGIMNTHSRYGDARLEIMAAHAAKLGADRETVGRMLECVTTDDAIALLDGADRDAGTPPSQLRKKTLESILERVDFHIKERTQRRMEIGAVMFSNRYGWLGQTADAADMIKKL